MMNRAAIPSGKNTEGDMLVSEIKSRGAHDIGTSVDVEQRTQWPTASRAAEARHLLDKQCLAAATNATWHEPREEPQQAYSRVCRLGVFLDTQLGEKSLDHLIVDGQRFNTRR